MSIFSPNPTPASANSVQSSQIAALTAKYQKQIEELKAEIKDLERKIIHKGVREDAGYLLADKAKEYAARVEKRNRWLEERNAELENPKGSHYASLSWPGRIIMCIRKLKRPLRFQEIMQELQILERLHKTENWLTEKTISVNLSNMAKDGRLHSEKVRGTRGNFYALVEWIAEDGKLPEKMRRKMW